MDKPKIKKAISLLFEAIGEDPNREGLIDTPDRVAMMYSEIFSGHNDVKTDSIKVYTEDDHQEMVIAKDLQFYSMCEHHILPFFGKVSIAYIPDKKICGISKLAEITDMFAKRLQLQERLTTQVANHIVDSVQPRGVMVIIEAEHLCMSMRGMKKPGTSIITSAVRGLFQADAKTRNEALELLK